MGSPVYNDMAVISSEARMRSIDLVQIYTSAVGPTANL
jgi:hypothetical protein